MRALFGFCSSSRGLAVGEAPVRRAAKKAKPARRPRLPAATRGPTNAADVIGRYAVLRSGKDTGCMLTLSAGSALLAPACRDNGIVIFDPKGWSLSQRRLSCARARAIPRCSRWAKRRMGARRQISGPQLGFRKM